MTSPSSPVSQPKAASVWLRQISRNGGTAAVLALVLPLVSGGLLLAQAGLLAHVLAAAIVGNSGIPTLVAPIALLGGVLAARIYLGFFGELFASASSEAIKLRLRRLLVATVLARPPVWTAARSGGALSSLTVEQVEAMDGYLTRYLPAMAQAALLPLAFAVAIIPIDATVGLIFLVTAPLIPVFMALAGWGAEEASRRQASALSRLSGHFADRLRGLTTLKLFGRDAAEADGVGRASEELRHRTMRVMRVAFLSSAILEFFAALGVAGVALYVGVTLLHLITLRGTPLTLEAALFCLLMAPEIYQPLRLLATHYHDRAAARAAIAEIEAQLGELPIAASSVPPVDLEIAASPHGAAPLLLQSVTIESPSGRPVIAGLNLALEPGEHIAILGTSGIGKSTLLEAIAGVRPYSGSIALDGEELASIAPERLRSRLALQSQRPSIFAGSIADNIRFGRRDACHAAVRLAAQRACVDAFADRLPDGLDTQLGENGLGLSGGEIHRVALARLYLRDPGLLLLDEPTAHLDAATEAEILNRLFDFAAGRTMIVATHSAAVAARVDRCLYLVDGRLAPASLVPGHQQGAE